MVTINSNTLNVAVQTAEVNEAESIENQIDTQEVDKDAYGNMGYKLMYQEWMQKILMSDGLDEDENRDW